MRIDQEDTVYFYVNMWCRQESTMSGAELMEFDIDSDREALDGILQEIWEDEQLAVVNDRMCRP